MSQNERALLFSSTRLYYAHGNSFSGDASSLTDSTDPFSILNLRPNHASRTRDTTSTTTNHNKNTTTVDMKEIKRAYRRMALIYHPDARTPSGATKEERQIANDDFARINEAYAFLMSRISKDKSLRIPVPDSSDTDAPRSTSTSTTTSTARTPKHTQTERKKKQQQQQHRKDRTSATNSSFYDSIHARHQSYSTGANGVNGYDINGNPRASTSASSSRRTQRTNANGNSQSQSHGQASSSSNTKRAGNNTGSHNSHSRVNSWWNPFSSDTHRAHDNHASPGSNSHTNHIPSPARSTPSSSHTKRADGHNGSIPSSPQTKRASGNGKSNRAKASLTFSKGEIVKITGGPYVGQRGTVRNMYPTMVKVAISASVDCFVDNGYVKHCTGSTSDNTFQGTCSSSTSSFNSNSISNHGYTDYGHDEFNVAFGYTTANSQNNNGDFQNPYGNYVEDMRAYNVNWKTFNSLHSTGELIKSLHIPLVDNSDYDSGSYSWTPSAGSAHKTDNIYPDRYSNVTYHGH